MIKLDNQAPFAGLHCTVSARVGIAASAVGGSAAPLAMGDWHSGPAWSTIKVPMVLAVLRAPGASGVTPEMAAAITLSDNTAADLVWSSLGDPAAAAGKVEGVLAEFGDPTVVQQHRVRPEYSAFGQTDWSLGNQSRFLAAAAYDPRNDPVMALMAAVSSDQMWGLGEIPGARIKGGWGPSVSGKYLVRQIALIPTLSGFSAVAVAAQPDSGTYQDGVACLTEVTDWVRAHQNELPAGRCAPS